MLEKLMQWIVALIVVAYFKIATAMLGGSK
jgi:hypothetical protein